MEEEKEKLLPGQGRLTVRLRGLHRGGGGLWVSRFSHHCPHFFPPRKHQLWSPRAPARCPPCGKCRELGAVERLQPAPGEAWGERTGGRIVAPAVLDNRGPGSAHWNRPPSRSRPAEFISSSVRPGRLGLNQKYASRRLWEGMCGTQEPVHTVAGVSLWCKVSH